MPPVASTEHSKLTCVWLSNWLRGLNRMPQLTVWPQLIPHPKSEEHTIQTISTSNQTHPGASRAPSAKFQSTQKKTSVSNPSVGLTSLPLQDNECRCFVSILRLSSPSLLHLRPNFSRRLHLLCPMIQITTRKVTLVELC